MDKKDDKETAETIPNVRAAEVSSKMPASIEKNQQASRRPKSRRGMQAFLLVVICFIVGIAGGFLASYLINADSTTSRVDNSVSYSKDDGNRIVTDEEQTITSVVEKVSPSVVSIVTTTASSGRAFAQQAAGTGMIVSRDGYVMTNKHVVDGAREVSVVTSDGRSFDNVEIVGSDPLNDIAFLKISSVDNLPVVTLGDSKTVRVGQQVVAIGNALGQYQNSVTSGIISGLGRPVVASSGGGLAEAESLSDLLQTDAAINSGNSGGPLLNSSGQVIGINTAVAQNAQGIGFAIPIGAAKGMLNRLVETGEFDRPFIGVQYLSITPEVKAEYDLDVSQGDYLWAESGSAIRSDGPADRAGLEDGDIVTKVGDVTIGPGRGISTLIGEYQPGDKLTLTLLRDGRETTRDITLGSY